MKATPLPPGCRDLYRASNKGNVGKVRRILSMGVVNVNCRVVRTTPLMTAARSGQTEVVKFLVSKGADVSLIDLHRNNSLHLACASGNVHTVMFVLSLSVVDIDAKNVFGRTAAMLARYGRHQRVVDLLESHGAQ
ncbi:palmitoyltransferase AKR1-like [Haliotis rufescens]|uniref:palmitoyltransferase AKR1-like n=1 Tax=Haliotis rufescens TaxID=6454 RepID=UPI00201E9C32|nr:palmitoyltransferase AKR1-like [Haliotis rufescens]